MPKFVERSVKDIGSGRYVIALSKPWVRCFCIKPSEKLQMIQQYRILVRKPVPTNLRERISGLHARALLRWESKSAIIDAGHT